MPALVLAVRFEAATHRVRSACRRILAAFAAEHGLPDGLFRGRIERREALAGRAFKPVGERPGVVGDEPGGVPRPRNRHMERAAG